MPKKSISFQDLMEECEFTDEKEFRRILNRNGYQLRRHHPIEKEVADEIMRRLTGRDIDWYKRRQEDKDQQHDGPIRRQQTDEIVEIIETWFERLGRLCRPATAL